MARAYKCDRCGKLFEDFCIDTEHVLLEIYIPYAPNKQLDLCPECQEKLDRFIGLGQNIVKK